jgi:hypothetical protein
MCVRAAMCAGKQAGHMRSGCRQGVVDEKAKWVTHRSAAGYRIGSQWHPRAGSGQAGQHHTAADQQQHTLQQQHALLPGSAGATHSGKCCTKPPTSGKTL